jgi:uncharacterized protein
VPVRIPAMRRLSASLLVFYALLFLLGCARGPCVTISSPDGKQLAALSVEIADDTIKREVGLMYRKHLDEYAGMIFVFPQPEALRFWMKNTVIPLDMIFADQTGRITGIIANAVPFSEKTVGVSGLSQYVLEVNGGFAARHSIVAGDRMHFSGFEPVTGK